MICILHIKNCIIKTKINQIAVDTLKQNYLATASLINVYLDVEATENFKRCIYLLFINSRFCC